MILKQSLYQSLHFDVSNQENTKVYRFCIQFLLTLLSLIHFLSFSEIMDLIDDTDELANARQLIMNNDLNFDELTTLGVDNTNVKLYQSHSVYSLFKKRITWHS